MKTSSRSVRVKRGADSKGPYYKAAGKKVHYKAGSKSSRASAKGKVVSAAHRKRRATAARRRIAYGYGGANIVHLRLRKN